jgi:hypothetical protein
MNSKGKEVDLKENLEDRVKSCCSENLTTTDLMVSTIQSALELIADIAAGREDKKARPNNKGQGSKLFHQPVLVTGLMRL